MNRRELKVGDIVRAKVRRTEVFGVFCECRGREILVLIPETSWIPCFNSCHQFASVGDELEVKLVVVNEEQEKIAGSIRAMHPENNPWEGSWQLRAGDEFSATVIRWVEKADRCGDNGGYLVALRPAAFVMLCGLDADAYRPGDVCPVVVTSIDERRRQVKVQWKEGG